MGRYISISLGDHFEEFVDKRVSTGRFKNASEVVWAGLRLLEGKILTDVSNQKYTGHDFLHIGVHDFYSGLQPVPAHWT